MSAATKIQPTAESRRQIFRIADPDFSNVRIEILFQGSYLECTCLDISALGAGVLGPKSAFGSVESGTIVEYRLSFGPLSPVTGFGLITNRAETSLHSEDGSPLVRLGVRFSDKDADAPVRTEFQQRRSQRFHISAAFRPLCICDDPLWLGDLLSIAILDLSEHGLSGLVSAKKTVIAEGLRTVFRIGFPHLGVIEVPVRVIYANPTDDIALYRIGCEFVGRNENFPSALRTFVAMHLMGNSHRPNPIAKKILPSLEVVSDRRELESAEESFQSHVTEIQSSNQVQIHTIYSKLRFPRDTSESFFRFEVHSPHEIEHRGPHSEEYILGRQYFYVSLWDFVDTSTEDLGNFVAGLMTIASIRHVHSLRFAINKQADVAYFDALQAIGLHVPETYSDPMIREFRMSNLRLGLGIERSLWLKAFLPLSVFSRFLHGPDFEFGRSGNLLLKLSAPLASRLSRS